MAVWNSQICAVVAAVAVYWILEMRHQEEWKDVDQWWHSNKYCCWCCSCCCSDSSLWRVNSVWWWWCWCCDSRWTSTTLGHLHDYCSDHSRPSWYCCSVSCALVVTAVLSPQILFLVVSVLLLLFVLCGLERRRFASWCRYNNQHRSAIIVDK